MSHTNSSGAGGPAPPQAPFLKGLSSESPKGSRLCHGSSIWGRKRALSRDGGSGAAGIPRHQHGTERGGEGRDSRGLPAAPRQRCCPPGSSPGPHLDVFLGVLGRGSLPQRVAPGLGRTLADTKRQAAASRGQPGSRAGARSCGTPPHALPALPSVPRCAHRQPQPFPRCPRGPWASRPRCRPAPQHLRGQQDAARSWDGLSRGLPSPPCLRGSFPGEFYSLNHNTRAGWGCAEDGSTSGSSTAHPGHAGRDGRTDPTTSPSPPSSEKFSACTGVAPAPRCRGSLPPPRTEDRAPGR